MKTRKTAQQLIRESVRRILREGMGDTLKSKLFGTVDQPTALRTAMTEKWAEGEVGSFKFVFTPSADKTKLTVAVTAEGGADDRAASMLSDEADAAVKALVPADWADVGPSWTFVYPTGTSYRKEETMDLKESWARIAGILTEAPVPAAPAAPKTPPEKQSVIRKIASKIVTDPNALRGNFIFTSAAYKGGDALILASTQPSVGVVGGWSGGAFANKDQMLAAVKTAAAPFGAKVGTPEIYDVEANLKNPYDLRADMNGDGTYETLDFRIYKRVWLIPVSF